jgi:anti-sigma B factor antagonist
LCFERLSVSTGHITGVDFWLDVGGEGDTRVVRLFGELDLAVEATVRDAVGRLTGCEVVMNLDGLTFIDAGGLRVILAARDRVLSTGRGFHIVGAHGIVERVFQITGTDGLLG